MNHTNSPEEWTQSKHERFVVKRFCAHLGDHFKIVKQRETPDFVISDGSREIGLEITRYRTLGPENEAEESAHNLMTFIRYLWLDDETVNHWSATLYFRVDQSRRGQIVYLLPRTDEEKGALIEDLKRLVRQTTRPPDRIRFYFVNETKAALPERLGNDRILSEQDYPTLSHLCHEVVIFYSEGARLCLISSNFNTGSVGIDADALGKLVKRKMDRLPTYRANLPEVPIWLLIYNEGDTISRRVESLNYPKTIVQTVKRLHDRRHERFNALWWGTNMMLEGSSEPEFMKIC